VHWLYQQEQEFKMELVRVTGTNFVRDINSRAILPTDNTEKNEYYAKLRLAKMQKDEINKVKSEIDCIKTDMTEIKSLLQQLLIKG
jgi:hypothetical protein